MIDESTEVSVESLEKLSESQFMGDPSELAFRIRLHKPAEIQYRINSLSQSWYEISTSGFVIAPKEFKGWPCHLDINPMTEFGYVDYGANEKLGTGSFYGGFAFHLRLPAEMVREIVELPQLAKQTALDQTSLDERDWFRLALNVKDFSQERKDEKLKFDIVWAYFSGVYGSGGDE